jgi:hypothetical protein
MKFYVLTSADSKIGWTFDISFHKGSMSDFGPHDKSSLTDWGSVKEFELYCTINNIYHPCKTNTAVDTVTITTIADIDVGY